MAISAVAAFWALSLLLVLTPGADWAYAISAGLRDRALPAVGGLLSGYLAHTAIVAVGIGALVAGSPLAYAVLTVAGSVYLLWLGIATLASPTVPKAGEQESTDSFVRWAAKGAAISGLNPKALLLFLALLPQFTDPGADWPVAVQIVLLGLVHTASCAVVYTGVGTAARIVLGTRPAAARWVTRISGAVMVGIGVLLFVEQLVR